MRSVQCCTNWLVLVTVCVCVCVCVCVLVMLRSWTTRSFWTNLLGERIVLVHVIHWLIFLVHWNSSQNFRKSKTPSGSVFFTMVKCKFLSLLQICQTTRARHIVQQLVLFIHERLLLNEHAHHWPRCCFELNEREISFVNELNELVHVVREWIKRTGTCRSWTN